MSTQQQQRYPPGSVPYPQQSQRPGSASSSAAGSNPFISPEQAANIQTTLQQIERQMGANVKHIEESLYTPLSTDQARADYHSILTLLDTLEQQTLPIAGIGYEPTILAQFQASPPSQQDAIGRFTEELTQMNAKLKAESSILQTTINQTTSQAKMAGKEFKAGMERMKQGTVPIPVAVEQQGQQVTQQAMHAAQMQFHSQQQQLAQRMR